MKPKKIISMVLAAQIFGHTVSVANSDHDGLITVGKGLWSAGKAASPGVKALLPGNAQEMPAHFDKKLISMAAFHEKQMQTQAVASSFLRVNQEVFNWITDASIVIAAPTGVGLAVALGVKYSVDQSMNYLHDHVTESLKESARNHLSYALNEYTKNNAERNIGDLGQLSPDDLYKQLFGSASASEKHQIFSNLDEKDYRILEKQIQQEIQHNLVANTLKDLARDKVTQEKLAGQQKDIGKLRTAFESHKNKSNHQMELLADQTKHLRTDIDALKKETGKNSSAIAAVSDFLYSKAAPSEQLQLLENPAFMPNLTGPARERAKSIASRKKFIEQTAGQYLNGIGDIAKIAQGLGFLKPKQAAKIAKAVSYGQAALGLATSIMSGNPFGALNVVGGLFGGGGSSRDEEAHRKLDQIITTLGIMDQKLDHIIKLQEQTIVMIQALHHELKDFREAFELSHLAIMDRLKMIENRQIVGNRILGELSFGDMGQCESFLNSRKKYGYSQRADGTFGFTSLERLSFEEDDQGIPIPRHVGLQPFLENQFDRLQECFASGLNKFFENSEKEKGFLNLSIAEEKGIEGKVDSKREQIDATLKVLNVSEEIMDSNQSTAGDLDQQLVQNLAKLSAPVSKMAHVKLKSETQINLQEEDTNEIWKLYRDHIKGGSSVWLSSMALESVLKTLTEVLPYDEFMTEDRSQLMPPGVVERSRKKWNTHWDYLELSQKWLKIARLQHHMLTGDVLLPKIERILFKRAVDPQNSSKYLNQNLYSDRSVQYKVVSEALQKNPLLKANLAKWIFSQNLADKSGKDFISSYEYFRDLSQIKNAKNPSLEIESRRQQLKRLAREGLERRGLLSYQDLDIQYVKTDKDQFKLILMNGQFSLDLPSAQELYADSHFLSDEVVRLNSLSQKVFDVKSDYLYQSWAEYKDPKYQSFRELGLVYRGIMGTVLD